MANYNPYNQNAPGPISDVGSSSLQGKVSASGPNIPTPQAMSFQTSVADHLRAIQSLVGDNIQQKADNAGLQGPATQSLNGYTSTPVPVRVTPKKIHSLVKGSLPGVGTLYNPNSIKVKKIGPININSENKVK